ncbi:MAG: hypothetical protein IH845_05760 [Nanoarchaeota archaeon]|nr:hypothetical protein [Nanoarchaeota archaeon]
MIIQEKTDEELNKKASEIIDSLGDFNVAERFKIISSLHDSLLDTIKEDGIVFEIKKGNTKQS